MNFPSSYIQLNGLLSKEDLEQLDKLLPLIPFEDGRATATGLAKEVKANLQSVRGSNDQYIHQAEQVIMKALSASPLFHAAALPKMILPLTISKYEPGMSYGWHTDSPLMSNMATIRVDLSMTLFLCDPETYSGGELIIHTPTGLSSFKLNKGDAIIYPTTRLHCVNPVTAGARVAAVSWMQSMVRDTEKREMIFQLKTLLDTVGPRLGNTDEHLLLQQIYCNLTRMWVEL